MGNSNSNVLADEKIVEIENETGFTRKQIQRLYKRFNEIDKTHKGYLEREDFMRIAELAINPLGDRLVDAFFTESVAHPNQSERYYEDYDDRRLIFRQFARVLAYFRPISDEQDTPNYINSKMNKLRFAFSMYDLGKNNFITRQEFKFILNIMIGANITKDQLDSIVDRTIIEADLNKDGHISFEEFCAAMDRIDIGQKMSIRFMN